MKINEETCDECPDPSACNTAGDCLIAKDGGKRLSDLTPQEVLDSVCPSGPLTPKAPARHEDAA